MSDRYAKNPMAKEYPQERRERLSREFIESHTNTTEKFLERRRRRREKVREYNLRKPPSKREQIAERLMVDQRTGSKPVTLSAGSAWLEANGG